MPVPGAVRTLPGARPAGAGRPKGSTPQIFLWTTGYGTPVSVIIGGINTQSSTPGPSHRLADALIRIQIRFQNDPRHAARVAGAAFGLLFLLALVLGFFFSFDDQPPYLLVALAFLGAALGAPLFAVTLLAFLNRSVGGRVIPAETDPADVRAARRALRAGEPSGRPEVDRIARVLASQARRHEMPLWMFGALFTLVALSNLVNAGAQYGVHGGWHWTAVFGLVAGVLMLVGVAVGLPLEARRRRRTRAFAAAFTARGEEGRAKGPERP
ncbi:hypothetical protein NE857_32405 [Nocardiopsis exhalans]|uniref:Uncharacterized protein n=2 Tax=Nocardiopsis TaxID=2013 RepID=A0A840WPC2_9ACTN|nr:MULTISPECIES: hypothetical protein [Nocardiopsis]MBB5493457.1 hypothetical protein [Nocardiopsis metallicus]USY19874.1 hypothetical protein NE857_32405 [Nocardiopsis exhalans]